MKKIIQTIAITCILLLSTGCTTKDDLKTSTTNKAPAQPSIETTSALPSFPEKVNSDKAFVNCLINSKKPKYSYFKGQIFIKFSQKSKEKDANDLLQSLGFGEKVKFFDPNTTNEGEFGKAEWSAIKYKISENYEKRGEEARSEAYGIARKIHDISIGKTTVRYAQEFVVPQNDKYEILIVTKDYIPKDELIRSMEKYDLKPLNIYLPQKSLKAKVKQGEEDKWICYFENFYPELIDTVIYAINPITTDYGL